MVLGTCWLVVSYPDFSFLVLKWPLASMTMQSYTASRSWELWGDV
jgi:hypothetical protein